MNTREPKNIARKPRRDAANPGRKPGETPSFGSADEAKPGDRIVVTIKRIGINGEGVGFYRRKVVFVPAPCRARSSRRR